MRRLLSSNSTRPLFSSGRNSLYRSLFGFSQMVQLMPCFRNCSEGKSPAQRIEVNPRHAKGFEEIGKL